VSRNIIARLKVFPGRITWREGDVILSTEERRALLKLLWGLVIYLFICLYPLFGNLPKGQTGRRIFALNGSNDADSRKDVPLWGFIDTAAHLGVKFPQNPYFWVINWRFPAKRVKYWKFHIIEATASITTKFCTVIKDHQVPFEGGLNTTQTNPRWRWPPSWKIEKSLYSQWISDPESVLTTDSKLSPLEETGKLTLSNQP